MDDDLRLHLSFLIKLLAIVAIMFIGIVYTVLGGDAHQQILGGVIVGLGYCLGRIVESQLEDLKKQQRR